MPAGGGPVKRLTDYPGQDHVPSWSPDGKWIYFGSTRAGGHEIFRMRPDGSAVQQMTHNGGYYGVVAPDGKWLYYSVQSKGLWKMPADGGETTQVLAPASLTRECQLRGHSARASVPWVDASRRDIRLSCTRSMEESPGP